MSTFVDGYDACEWALSPTVPGPSRSRDAPLKERHGGELSDQHGPLDQLLVMRRL
jgi:hypothetical protein